MIPLILCVVHGIPVDGLARGLIANAVAVEQRKTNVPLRLHQVDQVETCPRGSRATLQLTPRGIFLGQTPNTELLTADPLDKARVAVALMVSSAWSAPQDSSRSNLEPPSRQRPRALSAPSAPVVPLARSRDASKTALTRPPIVLSLGGTVGGTLPDDQISAAAEIYGGTRRRPGVLRATLLVQLAGLYERHLKSPEDARNTWTRYLTLYPTGAAAERARWYLSK